VSRWAAEATATVWRLCTGEGGGATANGGKAVLADWAAASKPSSRAAS